jgi:hypothetical protein
VSEDPAPHLPATGLLDSLRADGAARVFVHDIFSHEYMARAARDHPELNARQERALLLANGTDVVCVLEPVDRAYLGLLAELGIGPGPERVVTASEARLPSGSRLTTLLAADAARLARIGELVAPAIAVELHPFISTWREAALARALSASAGLPVRVRGGDPEVVERADHKHLVRPRAEAMGVPVADGEIVSLGSRTRREPSVTAVLERAIRRLAAATGRAIVKGSRGALGTMTRLAGPDEAAPIAREICESWENEACVVESFLELTLSPNVMMHVAPAPGPVRCVGVTDQRLDPGLAHRGNVFPSAARTLEAMLESATRLSRWLQSEGFDGLAGFDFGEYRDPASGRLRHFFVEVNPRVNASVYPLAMLEGLNRARSRAGHPPLAAFVSGTDATALRSFAELRHACSPLFLRPGGPAGVVPYVTGYLPHGKAALVAFGRSPEEAEDLRARAVELL